MLKVAKISLQQILLVTSLYKKNEKFQKLIRKEMLGYCWFCYSFFFTRISLYIFWYALIIYFTTYFWVLTFENFYFLIWILFILKYFCCRIFSLFFFSTSDVKELKNLGSARLGSPARFTEELAFSKIFVNFSQRFLLEKK